jgi:hypothetical protein
MLLRMILALSAALLLSPLARAQECQNLGRAEREAQVQKAPSCDAAMAAFSDCAYGATGDVGLADIATDKCEAEFLPSIIRTPRWRTYQSSLKRCDEKYEKMEGTMYVAMAANCRAELAQGYARRFNKAKSAPPKPGKRKKPR